MSFSHRLRSAHHGGALLRVSRLAFMAGVLALSARAEVSARQRGTRLVLLGTGGGPRPRKASSGSAQVIVSNGVAYVIDCGDGVARQLAFARIPLASLRHIFITHQHSDHTADYGNLIHLAWTTGLHELREAGAVMSDEHVRVTAALVDHPPVVPAFAYRFDTRDRSVVISGDTAPSPNLVKLAAGADVLAHSVMYPPAIDRLVARVPNAATLKATILAHQTSAQDAGRLAQEAGVKTLVLSHFVPPDDEAMTDTMWRDAATRHFRETVIVGRDLLEI